MEEVYMIEYRIDYLLDEEEIEKINSIFKNLPEPKNQFDTIKLVLYRHLGLNLEQPHRLEKIDEIEVLYPTINSVELMLVNNFNSLDMYKEYNYDYEMLDLYLIPRESSQDKEEKFLCRAVWMKEGL
jgi:hypothetical protein